MKKHDTGGEPVNIVASNLKRLRAENRLTRLRLSEISGVSVATLANIECTSGACTTRSLEAIAASLGVSPAEFWRPLPLVDEEHHVRQAPPYLRHRKELKGPPKRQLSGVMVQAGSDHVRSLRN